MPDTVKRPVADLATGSVNADDGAVARRQVDLDGIEVRPGSVAGSGLGDGGHRGSDSSIWVSHARRFGGTWTGVARAGLDYYGYAGTYPFESQSKGTIVQHDGAHSVQASGELTLNRRSTHDVLTIGAELRRSLHNHQFVEDIHGSQFDEHHPSDRLRLQINNRSAEDAGLKISSRLLQLAVRTP